MAFQAQISSISKLHGKTARVVEFAITTKRMQRAQKRLPRKRSRNADRPSCPLIFPARSLRAKMRGSLHSKGMKS
ncbi:MAG: hypothetical protein CPDRYMAC_3068 [uncultured Paraburkholderia sp.]|nr:MAG: hypothetical protein CPDRYDRY_2855 [uncultured Paraburkholderia sp.]CAH2928692.1 MAG: hypothetical protein CPDRYMAC_3068 [uncultured Paraburkholderia sp.]